MTYVCPTLCDDDCGTFCHETHVPKFKRDHDTEKCERKVLSERFGVILLPTDMQTVANMLYRLEWDADLYVTDGVPLPHSEQMDEYEKRAIRLMKAAKA